jgi:hypothetical protein
MAERMSSESETPSLYTRHAAMTVIVVSTVSQSALLNGAAKLFQFGSTDCVCLMYNAYLETQRIVFVSFLLFSAILKGLCSIDVPICLEMLNRTHAA